MVLSSCNSGRVRAGGGEEVSGVAQGFLAAGAQSLVAGLWAVHDEATVALMEELYRGLRSAPEAGVASALRDAGRKARERWDHPAYWGGFAAFEGRPLGVLRKP